MPGPGIRPGSPPRSPWERVLALLADGMRPIAAYGAALALGLLVFAAAAVALAQLTEDVVSRDGLTWLDVPVNSAVPGIRTPALTAVMGAMTLTGSAPAIIGVVVLGGLLLWHRTGTWRPAALLAVVGGGAAVLDSVYKLAVARPRPPATNAIADAYGYAFPSGHTTQAAVYAGFAYFVAATAMHLWARVLAWVAAVVVGVGIGASRVYLGVHWVTDVLGGWALGTAWLAFVLIVANTLARIRPNAAFLSPPRSPHPSGAGTGGTATTSGPGHAQTSRGQRHDGPLRPRGSRTPTAVIVPASSR